MAIIGYIYFVFIDVNNKSLHTKAEPSFVSAAGKPDRDADRMISEVIVTAVELTSGSAAIRPPNPGDSALLFLFECSTFSQRFICGFASLSSPKLFYRARG
ncbi:uncharacterized protein BO88DRAFT_430332 [Aspergillus vadensis CBS 113365]|uniref:Uncharacterized protein n=1 Tax=Aspergillus vadensis (strain CBS 113365 / IMI 142717 / IBT 24658) TaxID=1448311 RepID=A0A319ATD4_ASPVC|nr:hypothetical protein BO88DRAFT_430332 [Aspergillus vadensis CBS 113365]PYH63529.1 hypothetical protein BO88DRAFT_430332 [Aspergillus vadensis CBS 113365]